MGLLCNPYVKFTLRTLVVVLILAVSAIATGPPVPRPSKQTKGVRTFSGYGYIKVSAREWPFHPGAKPAGWLTDSGGWTQALRPRGLFLADVKNTRISGHIKLTSVKGYCIRDLQTNELSCDGKHAWVAPEGSQIVYFPIKGNTVTRDFWGGSDSTGTIYYKKRQSSRFRLKLQWVPTGR